MFYIFIIVFIISLIFYMLNKLLYTEYFYGNYISTWTPYIVDREYQPGYTNYFYNNGYMYPVF
jgi:hypothetical protein